MSISPLLAALSTCLLRAKTLSRRSKRSWSPILARSAHSRLVREAAARPCFFSYDIPSPNTPLSFIPPPPNKVFVQGGQNYDEPGIKEPFGVPRSLTVYKDAIVMLRHNIDTDGGHVNGELYSVGV
jgi:hypothetical protein